MSTHRCEHGNVISTTMDSFRCYECAPLEPDDIEEIVQESIAEAIAPLLEAMERTNERYHELKDYRPSGQKVLDDLWAMSKNLSIGLHALAIYAKENGFLSPDRSVYKAADKEGPL